MQGKQAKIVSPTQERAILGYLATTRYPARDRVMFLLSMKAGLRAKEMASLTWAMVTDATGQVAEVLHGREHLYLPLLDEVQQVLAFRRFREVLHEAAAAGFVQLFRPFRAFHDEQPAEGVPMGLEGGEELPERADGADDEGVVTGVFEGFFRAVGIDGCF